MDEDKDKEDDSEDDDSDSDERQEAQKEGKHIQEDRVCCIFHPVKVGMLLCCAFNMVGLPVMASSSWKAKRTCRCPIEMGQGSSQNHPYFP